jgi:competence protein ComEA
MDDSAAPWRALETTTPAATAEPPTPRQQNLLPMLGLGLASVLGIGAFLAASAGGSGGRSIAVDGEASVQAGSSGDSTAIAGVLVVEIVGAVDRPGVYRLPPGSRVGDLVTAAGGYGPRVDTTRAAQALNLAAQLEDGQQIRVPSRDDPAGATGAVSGGGASGGGASGGGASGGLVNLNSASQSELEALPGIGPVTASKIMSGRPFASVDDLKTRKVVGEATFNKIRELVTAP